jgi:hypothetical protein
MLRNMSEFSRIKKVVAVATLASSLSTVGGEALAGGTASASQATQRLDKYKSHADRNIGYDVSWPQCHSKLPRNQAFGIVGLNGKLANNFNPCFTKEVTWASQSTGVNSPLKAAIYVHVGNPGNTVSDWPKTGDTPDGACTGANTDACSYQYGENLANEDIRHLTAAKLGSLTIFMDVESNYSWQNSNHEENNIATLEGMTNTFEQANYPVGIYSNGLPFEQITGGAPQTSNLATLPDWILGGHNIKTANEDCKDSFTGKAVLAQIAGENYSVDQDINC